MHGGHQILWGHKVQGVPPSAMGATKCNEVTMGTPSVMLALFVNPIVPTIAPNSALGETGAFNALTRVHSCAMGAWVHASAMGVQNG